MGGGGGVARVFGMSSTTKKGNRSLCSERFITRSKWRLSRQ